MEHIKEQMTSYWTKRVASFSDLRMRELEGEKHLQWRAELEKYLPMDRSLKILDIGTGTGFFCFLLGEAGHKMTGIDLTEGMIAEAKATAARLHIPAEFLVMDAEKLDFESQTFDAIVTRNLSWQLPHLSDAYAEWHRVLKPGGILINFDADYCREKGDEPLPENHAHKSISTDMALEYERMKEELRPSQNPRPQWDVKLLEHLAFSEINVDESVWKRIYDKKDEFYNPTPIFTLVAKV